jgi:hypothetical protein
VSLPFDLPLDVPVDPDGPEAQRWLIEELATSPYQSAKPSPFDQLVTQITDWINSLIDSLGSVQLPGAGNLLNLLILLGVVAVLVVAFLIFGLPRVNRRSAATGELFGEDDVRDAAVLRRDADRAAAAGDYTTAIEELFRAVARGLDERTLVSFFPGSTARDVAVRAGAVFPDAADRLLDAARGFDGVRYLGATGTAEGWQRLVELERELRTARPPRELVDEIAVPQ